MRAALRSEPRLGPDFSPERLDIDGEGTLTIVGEAPSVAAKKLALERVAALAEVTGILDRLRVAPASPMAKVAVGMPAGICTMESRESTPFKVRDFTGTASTGTVVMAEAIPGR